MDHLIEAFRIAFVPIHFLTLVVSTFFGIIVGILPGLTAVMAVALLTGLTFGFGPDIAIISLVGVYTGAISGGSQAGILLNIPGLPASAATVVDGYPLNLQGKAGLAIFLGTAGSMFGTLIGVVFILFLTPPLTAVGLQFQSYEFFLLALFGIMICGSLAGGDPLKGWIGGLLGLLIATVGMDPISGFFRFTFNVQPLSGGFPLISFMIAIFGFPEIVKVFAKQQERVSQVTKYKFSEGAKIMATNTPTVVRSGLIGTFLGIIPGVGEDVGAWMSYWAAKTFSKDKSRFGKGAYEGVIASEAGSNASKTGALIPVLSLAIPGSTAAAVILAAFFMHGHRPGPLLMMENPGLVSQIAVFFFLSAIALFILTLGITRFSVKILTVKKEILMPNIFVLCAIGSYLVRYTIFDAQIMFLFGFVGVLLIFLKIPPAPLLLGMVLGHMAESNLIRGLRLSGGSLEPFFVRPISLALVIVIALIILAQFSFVRKLVTRNKPDA
ncbi:MAG: tripartite tricarboxylate transporter permease [Defluviitaleaceae bacterium]|nr:tripartite tricarboxylate transporter permease [Defluviitaleaceae bacterium]